MLPLKNRTSRRTRPLVGWAVTAACAAVFFAELQRPELVELCGFVPADVARSPRGLLVLVTHVFLHGGVLHLLGNLWFLHVFGDAVEARLGHRRFLVFFLVCGVLAGLCHAVAMPMSRLPLIGASGAISGVMGAYLRLHANERMDQLLFIVRVEGRVWTLVGGWALLQIVQAFMVLDGSAQPVAFWAHVGGFVVGLCWMSAECAARSRRGGGRRRLRRDGGRC